jgi:hypothetical protein
VNINVAAVPALRKKETQDETLFATKIGGKTSLGPSHFLSQQSKLSEILPTIGLNNDPLSKSGHYQIRHSPEVTAKGSMEFW